MKLSDGADNAVISNKNEYGEHIAKRVLTVKTISLYMTGRRAANSRRKGRDDFVNDLWSSNAPHIAENMGCVTRWVATQKRLILEMKECVRLKS